MLLNALNYYLKIFLFVLEITILLFLLIVVNISISLILRVTKKFYYQFKKLSY